MPLLQYIVCFSPGWDEQEVANLKGMDPEDVLVDQVRGHFTWEWWDTPFTSYFMPRPHNSRKYFDGVQVRVLAAPQLGASSQKRMPLCIMDLI